MLCALLCSNRWLMFIFHWMRNVITMGLDVRETRVEQIKSKSWFKPDTSIKCKCVCVCVQFGNSGNAELMGACNECERFLIMTEMWQILSSFVKYSFTHKLSVVHVLVRSVFFLFFWYSFRCGSSSSCWCALLSFAVFFSAGSRLFGFDSISESANQNQYTLAISSG